MVENKIFKTTIGNKEVSVEIGKYAQQSSGSCIVKCQDTVVLINANVAENAREGVDFLPLSVDYEEKLYAVGKIPGGYRRREGKPTDNAILVARLIDRPLRPLFPKNFHNDITVVATVLSAENDCPPEPFAMLGSSVALSISKAPFEGPTGSVVVGLIDDKFIINPTCEEKEKSDLHVTVSGTKDAITMVEAGANQVSEEVMLEAIMFAHEEIKKQVEFQQQIINFVKPEKLKVEEDTDEIKDLKQKVYDYGFKIIEKAVSITDNLTRKEELAKVEENIQEHFKQQYPDSELIIHGEIYQITKSIVRDRVLNKGIRIDGRKYDEIREIWCEVGLLPRVHGSAVFTRGRTQVLSTATLGILGEAQKIEGIDTTEEEKRYMHHYNMPPYASGEVRSLKSPGRREIGHGALAERAIEPVLPSEDEFPYAIRTVTEVLSSNGSTSQAAVCGSCLALMDAGVPIKAAVSGVAMGLMKDSNSDKVVVLTDIQGEEDFFGDMDFKVAGTSKGITAIQMDIKIKGINKEILSKALIQAKQGREFILNKMKEVLPTYRAELSEYAPKVITFNIDPEKIGEVVGKGGRVINKIIEATGATIDLGEDGKTTISTTDKEMAIKAKNIILEIVTPAEKGRVFEGVVTKITNFGAFITFGFNKEGLIHISKLSENHIEKVEDVLALGDKVKVEVIEIDDKNRVNLKLISKL